MNFKRIIGGPLLSIAFLGFFVYSISGSYWILNSYLSDSDSKVFLGSISAAVGNISESAVQPQSALEINAKSAISVAGNLKDVNKIVFEKNSDVQLPIASLTKLMTAIIVLDNYNLSDMAVVDKAADLQNPMKQDVKLGDSMPVENFLKIMLVGSSNKSAYALSELLGEQKFVDLMNQKAKDIGLEKTVFRDPTGLSSGDVSTASDLIKLTEYILKHYSEISEISKSKEIFVPGFGNVENTDQLLEKIPGVICSKTGFTADANGCLIIVVNNLKNNNFLINVVLGADDRFFEMEKLINWSSAACK